MSSSSDEMDFVKQTSNALGITTPLTILARPLRKSLVQFTRFTVESGQRRSQAAPTGDFSALTLALADVPARETCHGGRHFLKSPQKRGEFSFLDGSIPTTTDMWMAFDNIHMYFSKSIFAEIVAEAGWSVGCIINLGFAASMDDTIVRGIGHCLIPTFARPEQANSLFLDHLSMALLTHLAVSYGGAAAPRHIRGGLGPRQAQRAKDLLMSSLDGQISLDDLAQECGLSRSHFARAFKKSIGMPPHRWLMERRLERARELLSSSKLSLAEIADLCGFADQSHFTRSFSAATGIVPSEWRRLRCD